MNEQLSPVQVYDIYAKNGYGSAAGRVYDTNYIAPTLGAEHFAQIKWIVLYESGEIR